MENKALKVKNTEVFVGVSCEPVTSECNFCKETKKVAVSPNKISFTYRNAGDPYLLCITPSYQTVDFSVAICRSCAQQIGEQL